MNHSDILRTANTRFSGTDAKNRVPQIPFIPTKQVYVVTCIDPRVDPSDVFELTLGDAIVARTVGGRVTRDLLADMAWISYLLEAKTPDAAWFEVMVMHHTDCGSALMADDDLRAGFVRRGFDDAELQATAVTDPAQTVPGDVQRILTDPNLSEQIVVSGWAYDLGTGIATCVVAPTSRAATS